MLLNFVVDSNGFRLTNPEDPEVVTSVDYIKCHFDVVDPTWKNVDVKVAYFKSAQYNIQSQAVLDSNGNCFIDPEVYKRGGTIQVKLFGDVYSAGSLLSTSHITGIISFYINENIIVPIEVPSEYAVFIAELERATAAVNNALEELDEGAGCPLSIMDTLPSVDGTYSLLLTMTDGKPTISWIGK